MKDWKQVFPYPSGVDLRSRTIDVVINNNWLRFKIKAFQQWVSSINPYIKWTTGLLTLIPFFFAIPPLSPVAGLLTLAFFFSFDIHIRFSLTSPVMKRSEEGEITLGIPCRSCGRLNEYNVSVEESQPSNCEVCGTELMEVASDPEVYDDLLDLIESGEGLEAEVIGYDGREPGAFVRRPDGTNTRRTTSEIFSIGGIGFDEPALEAPQILLLVDDRERFNEMRWDEGTVDFDIVLSTEGPSQSWGVGILAPDGIAGIFYKKEFIDAVIEKGKFQVVFVDSHTEETFFGELKLSEIYIGKMKELRNHAQYQKVPNNRDGINQIEDKE